MARSQPYTVAVDGGLVSSTNVVNLPAATINLAAGYTITKVNDNSYTFVSGVTASTTQKGGGRFASAGPVTISP